MALENISNVPQICSGTLRIFPRALQFPQTPLTERGHCMGPPPYLPPRPWPAPSQIVYPPLYPINKLEVPLRKGEVDAL